MTIQSLKCGLLISNGVPKFISYHLRSLFWALKVGGAFTVVRKMEARCCVDEQALIKVNEL